MVGDVSGIYTITHMDSGRKYIGSSVNIRRRWREHRRALKRGTHHNAWLQRAWRKYGEKSFNFSLYKKCEISVLHAEEQALLDTVKVKFNVSDFASAPMLGRKHSLEARKKIAEANTGSGNGMYGRKHSEETIMALSDIGRQNNAGEKNPFYGKRHTEQVKKNIAEKLMGNKISKETAEKISVALKGRAKSQESVAKRCKAVVATHEETGKKLFFDSAKQAGEQGFDAPTIANCCKGKKPRHKGYLWSYR